MESEPRLPTLSDRLEVLRRRWPYPALIMPACLLIAIFIAFVLPPIYRSSATIILEPSAVPKEFVQTATSYADQQFELVQRRVMTTDSLVELVRKIDPYPHLRGASEREKARMVSSATSIERVDPVTLETLAQSNAFSIHYHNPDPKLATAVMEQIVALFLDYNRKTRRELASGTYRFLLSESRKLSESIREMEARLAEFKAKYGDALPEAQTRNLAALDAARQEYDALQAQIRLVEQREELLRLQLSEVPPTLVAAVSDQRLQLAQLRAELAEAEKRYTPEHPDVRRLRRAIQTLIEESRNNPDRSTVKPDNPEYLRISTELDAVRRELSALRARAARAQQQIDRYSRSLELAPNVEREYAQLARDYEIAQAQFRDIQNRLKEADLAQALVEEEQGERFTLIRPPSTPTEPYSPNRLGIILLGLLLGAALGIGAAMLVEMSDPTVRGARDLQELTGTSMIAAVPVLLNREDQRLRRFRWGSIAVIYGLAIIIVSAAVVGASA